MTACEPGGVEIEIHRGPLADLLDDWEGVFAADPRATPFVSPAWGRVWWEHWGVGADLWAAVVRDGARTVGLAPLIAQRVGPFRLLRVLGGEPGDYWDVLSVPERRSEVLDALCDELARLSGSWDVMLLDALSPGTETDAALERHSALRVSRRPPVVCPAIELPHSFDDYLASLPRKRRANLQRHLRRLDGGEVELRELNGEGELRSAIRRWHEIRERQWRAKRRRMYGLQVTARFRDFIADVVVALVPAGMASLWEFRSHGEVVGLNLNFHDPRSFYWYLGGYEPEFGSLGIGKVAIGHAIRSSITAGRSLYDFTRDPEPYKYWYGAEDRISPSMLAAAPGARGAVALAAAKSLARLRRIRG